MGQARNAQPLYCSFCGRPRTETRRLIAGPGPNGPFICNDCAALCVEMFAEEARGPHSGPAPPPSVRP